jgi:hypothetical protein
VARRAPPIKTLQSQQRSVQALGIVIELALALFGTVVDWHRR